MHRALLNIILAIVSISVFAQSDMKYKDVFDVIQKGDDVESYALLIEYQRQDPYQANTYYHLSNIAAKWAKTFNPLTQLDDAKYFCYNTRTFAGLIKYYADDKEIRKNRDYYTGLELVTDGKKPQVQDVQIHADKLLEDVKLYEERVVELNYLFGKSVEFYNKSVLLFRDINVNFNKAKELYLSEDERNIDKLDELRMAYDSSLIYFDQFKNAAATYQEFEFNQELVVQDIVTFRLDGLTNADFLQDKITIWNYAKWVDEVEAIMDSDIKNLRADIEKTENELNASIQYFKMSNAFTNDLEPYTVDKYIVNKISKFDHQSIVLDLFNYKQAKIAYLVNSRKTLNNPKDTTFNSTFLRKTRYYNELVNNKLIVDSVNAYFQSQIRPAKVFKYKSFFDTNYNGFPGLKKYSKLEDQQNQEILETSFNNLKVSLIEELTKNNQELVFASYKNGNIPLFKKTLNFELSTINQYHTTEIVRDNAGNSFITGHFKNENSKSVAFIAKTDAQNQIVWLKNYDVGTETEFDFNDAGVLLYPFENGLISVITSYYELDGVPQIVNTFVELDSIGKEKQKLSLDINLFPRFLKYDDLNEQIILAYKGEQYDIFESRLSDMVINHYERNGELNWSQKLQIDGDLIDIIKINADYLIFCNFREFVNPKGQQYSLKGSGSGNISNMLSVHLSEIGFIRNIEVFSSVKPYYGLKAIKLSDKEINILGLEGNIIPNINTIQPENSGKLFYLTTNHEGKVIYSNIEIGSK